MRERCVFSQVADRNARIVLKIDKDWLKTLAVK